VTGAHHRPEERLVAPFGAWASPIDADLLAGTSIGLAEPRVDGDVVCWLETRPTEGGRRTLLSRGTDGATRELTPSPFNVRNRVHEYGGGSYAIGRGIVVASSVADGRLWRLDPQGAEAPVAITPEGSWRFGDLWLDPARDRLYGVRETHPDDPRRIDLVRNELVAVALDGSDGAGQVLVSGPDFVAGARPSPDGTRLAWIEWDLPAMPWDATRLRTADVLGDGSLGPARSLAGGPGVSVIQPAWSPDGILHVISDETGWWNLYAFDGPADADGAKRNVAPMDAELGVPLWELGAATYAFLADGAVLASARSGGREALLRIEPDGGVRRLATTFAESSGLAAVADGAVAIVGGAREPRCVATLDGAGAVTGVLARTLSVPLDPGYLPEPEPIAFPTSGGATARALYFPPTNADFRGPDGERPPLVVISHGGPTSAASGVLSLDRAFFTSRGIAVVDVDYRGSTGYGRPYRDALNGRWGIVDVDDSVAAARYLVERGDVDPRRLVIRGGSAGGYTALAALAFKPDVFAAGISHFGIADLELIHNDGHKFESRYDEGLVAPWTPEGREVFRDRSPIHHLGRIRAPILLFQGLDDRVVPPSQLDVMEDAFTERGLPYVAYRFEGEGHGFRRAENRRVTYEAELAFLARVLRFTPADGTAPMEIAGLG
jgi:dipeptidyl aminopeptidase/acylaminoacyl peptidase